MVPSRRRKANSAASPILGHIMHGGSCVSLNLLALSHNLDPGDRLFSCLPLNQTVLFKFPNFESDFDEFMSEAESMSARNRDPRPIETGIYVPYHADEPDAGGAAIYIRQKDYRPLLAEYFGLTVDDSNTSLNEDLKILHLMDTVPSLDPFLMRDCFEVNGVDPKPKVLVISDNENREIREILRAKIGPIVDRAVQAASVSAARRSQFLEAIWNPTMPEAKLFVTAFGIREDEASQVFAAWKGVTFYQYQFGLLAARIRTVNTWLKARLPPDIRANKPLEQQFVMFQQSIAKKIDRVIRDVRKVIEDYETCFKNFLEGDPSSFAQFLRTVRPRYWVMGYCISALNGVLQVYDMRIKHGMAVRMDADNLHSIFSQMDVALSRKRELDSRI